MHKLSEREKEILSIQFTDDQVKDAINCQRLLQEYNDKLMDGQDVERPGLTMDKKRNMDLYFAQKTIKDFIKLDEVEKW